MKADVSLLGGPLVELVDQTRGENGAERLEEFKLWLKSVKVALLEFVRNIPVAAQAAVTTSKEYFEEAGVKSMGSNFETQFLGLDVPATDAAEIAVHKLTRPSRDFPILAELKDQEEISVSQFRTFLVANRNSNGWFLCYLRGKDGHLWAVNADWDADLGGWCVSADRVDHRNRWNAGNQVLSQA